MSYILDALRCAEAERQRGRVPGLHAPPAGAAAPAPTGRSPLLLAGVAIAALAVAGAAGTAWWLDRSTTPAPEAAPAAVRPAAPLAAAPASVAAPAPATVPAPAPLAAAAPAIAPTMVGATPVTAPVVVVIAPAAPALPPSAAVVAPALAAASAPTAHVPTLAELPESVRAALPALALGGTVYASAPAQRLVVLNGQVFHQGDEPIAGLVVKEIRPRSVVLSYRGQGFELAP